ncbi:M23 family metallopeptidase [Brevundimonas viscosa]|uniref:Murein DD-endopeptidase MepM and murein hydrolase activator NlpD, contain LysM domain n=1 Tax=Brevundimonas viscosa TaxID=871741 RepID=A0A1I6T1R9_9CAUL|nr:M23 family metallopeptidase [Brevundimonas viscosa]SFS83229.1 Murein DD-endopeptidase MepM and murein hydrolase activator NlpD, contain LysM domain [Brevundimonas viscosa]
MSPRRRDLLVGSAALLAAGPASARIPDLELTGRFVQGGHAIGRTWPNALVFVDGEALSAASDAGWFVVGFDRDAPASVEIEVRSDRRSARRTLAIAGGSFRTTRIDGLPPSTVEPTDPALLERIRREVVLKTEGFASRTAADHFRDGFDWPLASYRITSPWGAQRVLNGTPARPHYGIDLAAPQGTPVLAPAAGRVALAEPDLHFEGGLVLLDHGQGLITAYLHQSRLDVRAGQEVVRGQALGRVGMSGRATGPHLCWRMKWRDRNLDPSLLVKS